MAPSMTLPEGTTLDDLWARQTYTGNLAINAAVAFGILFWDYVQLLPEERGLYDSKRSDWTSSPAPWAFLLLRYAGIASTLSSLVVSFVNTNECYAVSLFSHLTSILVIAAAGIVFCCRIAALWEYNKTPIIATLVPYALSVVAWIAVATQFKASPSFEVPFGTSCQFLPLAEWTVISYTMSALFTITIFGMALYRMSTTYTILATNSGFTLINRACLIYLFVTTISTISLLVVYAIGWTDELLKRVVEPYYVLILVAMGSRVFLNLRLHQQTLLHVAESNHFTAPDWKPMGPDEPLPPLPIEVSMTTTTMTTPLSPLSMTQTLHNPPTPQLRTPALSFRELGKPDASPQMKTFTCAAVSSPAPTERRLDTATTVSTTLTGTTLTLPASPGALSTFSHTTTLSPPTVPQTPPRSPRRKPVPSIAPSTASASIIGTSGAASPPSSPRRQSARASSFRYFGSHNKQDSSDDYYKSGWNGI